jgi:hypothetical protein
MVDKQDTRPPGARNTDAEPDAIGFDSIDAIIQDLKDRPVEKSGNIYHPIPYPEFDGLQTSSNRVEAERKLEAVISALSSVRPAGLGGARILDIGANAGFYTFSLDQKGAAVTAFESNPRYGAIGRYLAEHRAKNVKWFDEPFNPARISGHNFDAALMLSVFQWMAAGGERLDEALRELRYISQVSDALVFELGYNDGKSALTTRKRNHYAALISFLRGNTRYKYYKLLATTRPWKGGKRYLVLCSNVAALDDPLPKRILRTVAV